MVCPYIKSTRVEQIRDVKNPSLRGRIVTTEYFERIELLDSAISSLEEAQAAIDGLPEPRTGDDVQDGTTPVVRPSVARGSRRRTAASSSTLPSSQRKR